MYVYLYMCACTKTGFVCFVSMRLGTSAPKAYASGCRVCACVCMYTSGHLLSSIISVYNLQYPSVPSHPIL